MTYKIDKGLLLFGFLMSTTAILAGIFASNVIPSIFQTGENVNRIQTDFNQSSIMLLNHLHNLSEQNLILNKEIKNNQKIFTSVIPLVNQTHENVNNILDNLSSSSIK